MVKGRVDVLIPTAGKRMNGLLFQAHAFKYQSYKDVKIWILVDSDEPNKVKMELFEHRVTDFANVEVVPAEWRGGWGHKPIRWALDNLPLDGEWLVLSGDDDTVTEWAIKCLVDSSEDVDMVVGKCIPTKRNHDLVRVVLGDRLQLGRMTGSCCMFKREVVKSIGYPYETYESDWEIVAKMKEMPYRIIESLLFVMPQSYT